MARMTWDRVSDRYYELGLDRGVLYLADGTAVPWNGLVAVDEDAEEEWEPVYFDGIKIRDVRKISEFSATLRAITYPDEFLEYDGQTSLADGVFATDQNSKRFSLCYRTKIGTPLEPDYGYRIHILFNLTAVADTKGYVTISDEEAPVDFAWKITAIPTDILKYRPTAHVVIDPRTVSEPLMADIERILYGTDTTDARLPSLQEFYDWAVAWWYLENTDNQDGSITIESSTEDTAIVWLDEAHTIANVVGIYTYNETPETYDITAFAPPSSPARYNGPSDPDHIIG